MKFTIITYIPSRQGLLAAIPEKVVLDDAEKDNIEEVIEGLHVPDGGYCLIVNQDDITKVVSKVVNEVIPRA